MSRVNCSAMLSCRVLPRSFWQEPMHTLASKHTLSKTLQFERYLDFYERVSLALRSASADPGVCLSSETSTLNGSFARNSLQTSGFRHVCRSRDTAWPRCTLYIQHYKIRTLCICSTTQYGHFAYIALHNKDTLYMI